MLCDFYTVLCYAMLCCAILCFVNVPNFDSFFKNKYIVNYACSSAIALRGQAKNRTDLHDICVRLDKLSQIPLKVL